MSQYSNYPGGFQSIAGLLSVPLSDSGKDFIALFRRGQTRHVHWVSCFRDGPIQLTLCPGGKSLRQDFERARRR